jgi:hypothetical protein
MCDEAVTGLSCERHAERKLKYRVVGWEDVEVPAGKFKALKIEADGSWSGEIAARTTASTATQAGAQGTTAVPLRYAPRVQE